MKQTSSPPWFSPADAAAQDIGPQILSWLEDEGSLTQRLKDRCPRQFAVEVLAMDWGDPDPTEAALLEIPETQSVLLREVHLKCADELCVYARSVIPRHTLEGPHQHLGELGDKPLGEYLFASPSLQRSQVEWTGLTPQSSLYQKALPQGSANGDTIWGRRSLFHIDNRPLLVSEFFLPVLFGAS